MLPACYAAFDKCNQFFLNPYNTVTVKNRTIFSLTVAN